MHLNISNIEYFLWWLMFFMNIVDRELFIRLLRNVSQINCPKAREIQKNNLRKNYYDSVDVTSEMNFDYTADFAWKRGCGVTLRDKFWYFGGSNRNKQQVNN